jgi:hypothetical protein
MATTSTAAAAAAATTTNARHTIERLLTTNTCSGKYSTGSKLPSGSSTSSCPIPTVSIVLRDDDGNETDRKSLSFPLNDKDVAKIKDHAERAGVGLIDRTVVNLDVRKTYVQNHLLIVIGHCHFELLILIDIISTFILTMIISSSYLYHRWYFLSKCHICLLTYEYDRWSFLDQIRKLSKIFWSDYLNRAEFLCC